MPTVVPAGQVVWGIQLPVQSQSRLYVEDWELQAGPAEVLRIAEVADRTGAFYVAVCDHVAIPTDLAPRMGDVWWDTVATLGWLAGQTTRTRLLSSVFNVNYRHPLVTAKSFATLDLLSGGRVILGVGAGHVVGEFAALQAPYDERGPATDEALRVIANALSESPIGAEGGRFHVAPRPVQAPRPPIWVGGSARAAVRRAARLADGWLPQGTPLKEMPPLVELFRTERAAAGHDGGGDIGAITGWVHVGDPTWDLDRPCLTGPADKVAAGLRHWTDIGVNHLQVRFPSRNVDELADQVEKFATEVAAQLAP